ncbi:hypothetical protein C8J55DRAFT_563258 [Lentinula edodes]|uniref:Uncharacterized protein n=1 Tax=Lentinula lateritia TaxID=40482 RepID=A0A9W9A1U9_9AGAR|nr:hypothetical protein C8J55DRAFT_563258 [Lentinula edodes]
MSTTNDTTSSSDNVHTTPTSTTTTSLSPTWAPPKAPLPPHRLAKLANALGVSTPIPVHHRKDRADRAPSPYLVPSPAFSALSLNTPDAYASIRETYGSLRRSPTPSSAGSFVNAGSSYTFTSKFLLHVIPPVYLPHDSQLKDNVPSGSGYHSQFRRGTLVAVHPTLQAQLWAIAKEYALPSITGIVLYIVNTSQPAQDQTTPTGAEDEGVDEPGPRLSEEIWRHLWTRVWKAEREELPPVLAPFGLPGPVTSPPLLAIDTGTPVSPLRPFLSTAGTNSETALSQLGSYPSPSTPSSASTLAFARSLRSRSPTSEGPDTDTPPTSHSNSLDSTDVDPNLLRANSLPLPGLNSPSLMPILAKVEFDIDRKKAGWYEPWAKRRRVKKKKKAKSDVLTNDPPKRLKLTGSARTGSPGSAFSWTDQGALDQLSDDEEDDDDDIGDEDETARVLSTSGPGSRSRRILHDLSLDDDDSDSDDGGVEQGELTRGAEEISEIMAQMGQKPSRSNSLSRKRIPPPLVLHPAGGAASKELKVPSPLNSATFTPPGSSSSSGSTSLPYLKGVLLNDDRERYMNQSEGSNLSELMDDEVERYRTKSPMETEKRTGGVYDDFDLDLGELDDDDPHDRRRSQIIFKAKLDEIERNLAQLSPRALKSDLEDDQFSSSARLSSPGSPFLGVPAGRQGTPVLMNSDILPPTPSTFNFNESPTRPRRGSNAASTSPARAQWPAVPYSVLTEEDEDAPGPTRRSRAESTSVSPPRLAINGVSTFAPNAFKRQDSLSGSSDISAETMKRRREAEEEQNLYPALNSLSNVGTSSQNSSPIIPLSPDPFGRFSSTPEPPEGTRHSVKVWDKVPFGGSVEQLIQNSKQRRTTSISGTGVTEAPSRNSEASSRFSADSTKDNIEVPASIAKNLSGSSTGGKDNVKEKTGNRTTVMSMKGIKKLWRKSNKTSVSMVVPPTPIPESPMFPPGHPTDEPLKSPPISTPSTRAPSPQSLQNLPQSSSVPIRPSRPSKEELDIPDIPDQLAIPLQPENGRPAPMPIIAAQMQVGLRLRSSTNGDRMQFDQESPYPMPARRPQQRKMSVSTNSVHSAPQLPSRTPSPTSSTGGSIGAAAGASMTGENRQANVRKSILKWKAAAATHQNNEQTNSNSDSRSNPERIASNSTVRPRAPSLNNGSHRSSVSTSEIPPSPKIPEHFLSSRAPPEHLRTGSHLTNSSTDSRLTNTTDLSSFQSLNSPSSSQTSHGSPPSKLKTDLNRNSSLDSSAKLSMDSSGLRKMSFDSQSDRRTVDDDDAYSDTHPSIDSSQFEMVSPKMEVGTLTYPYTTVGMHQ